MGSNKRHKSDKTRSSSSSRDAKRKRSHRSRSRSYSSGEHDCILVSETPGKPHKHKKHKRNKERQPPPPPPPPPVEYDSDIEIVSAPPPPKISRHSTHAPTSATSAAAGYDYPPASRDDRYSYKEDRHHQISSSSGSSSRDDRPSKQSQPPQRRSSPSPPKPGSGQSQASLSIEETNRLRKKLGLKPLELDSKSSGSGSGGGNAPNTITDDLGTFQHKPAGNVAERERTQKLKEKLGTMREKRQYESALAQIRTLGDTDEEGEGEEDAAAWVRRSKKIEAEKRKAADRAKLLDQMDEEFGVGNLVKEDTRKERSNLYSEKNLKGLRVEHSLDNFKEGTQVILTLKDSAVLAEDECDTLINVNMLDDERYKKNVSVRSKKPGYDAYDESHYDAASGLPLGRVLDKYDEEIEGEKREGFAIGEVDVRAREEMRAAKIRAKLENKRLESLEMPEMKLARDYYDEAELEKFRMKGKGKVRKVRKIRRKMLKADELLAAGLNGNDSAASNDYLSDLGSRRRRGGGRLDAMPDARLAAAAARFIESGDVLDVDDLGAPKEDLSGLKIDLEDREVEMKIKKKAEKLKGPMTSLRPEKFAVRIKPDPDDAAAAGPSGHIVLNSTAEFCRTLGDIPTYGQAGNREENTQEYMDLDMDEVKRGYDDDDDDEMYGRGQWNTVREDLISKEPTFTDTAILDAEPSLDQGVGGALKLAMSKGYLQKEDSNRPSASRFAHLQAQKYSIEDKSYGDDDKFSRRDRFNGPSMDFKEKEGFKPNVKLDYIDDEGHLLSAKEAFRYLSHKFHGKGPGKNKVEKRMRKAEQEGLMTRMSSTDTPLNTLTLLQAKQKETQSPFIVLSGSKQIQTASISKSIKH